MPEEVEDSIHASKEPAGNRPQYSELHRQFPDDFDIDCGTCGVEIMWSDFAVNDYKCPYCGWDSVRISPKQKED